MKHKILLLLIISITTNTFSQNFKNKFLEITKDKIVSDEKEKIVYEATNYIFSNSPHSKSEEFYYATKIAGFWMNLETKYGMPTFGKFYETLTPRNQKFFYTSAMMHYLISQKREQNRLIVNVKKEGVKFSELETVRETQLEGAKILLKYVKEFKVYISPKTKKYLKRFKKGNLENNFF